MSRVKSIKKFVDMLRSAGNADSIVGLSRAVSSRILPAAEKVVRANIKRDLPEIIRRTADGGQSYDAIRGKFIKTLYDEGIPVFQKNTGYIMAPARELNNARTALTNTGKDLQIIEEAVRRMADDPTVINRLRRGDLFGTWKTVAGDSLVVDPSRRYLTRGGSLVSGKKSMQQSGFSPRSGAYEVYKTNQLDPAKGLLFDILTGKPVMSEEAIAGIRAYRRAQAGLVGGAIMGGGAGYLGLGE